jgi:hypothetical protein
MQSASYVGVSMTACRSSQRPYGSNLPSEQEHDMLMNNTLYQAPGDEDAGAFPESSTLTSPHNDFGRITPFF